MVRSLPSQISCVAKIGFHLRGTWSTYLTGRYLLSWEIQGINYRYIIYTYLHVHRQVGTVIYRTLFFLSYYLLGLIARPYISLYYIPMYLGMQCRSDWDLELKEWKQLKLPEKRERYARCAIASLEVQLKAPPCTWACQISLNVKMLPGQLWQLGHLVHVLLHLLS